MFKSLLPWKLRKTKVLVPESVMEDEIAPTDHHLIPCDYCKRTFLPGPLKKHTPICEKNTQRKIRVFDSLKQRIEGTDLAQFHSKIYIKKPESTPKILVKSPKWDEVAVKGAPPNMSAKKRIQPASSSNERCPHCDRHFGPKAFDRHVEWCKEHQARIQKSPAIPTSVAKERLDARINYRAPLATKTKKLTVREKYSPSMLNINRNESVSSVKSSPGLQRTPTIRKPHLVIDLTKKEAPRIVNSEVIDVKKAKSLHSKRFCPRQKVNSLNINENIKSITVSPMSLTNLPRKQMISWKDISKKKGDGIVVMYENYKAFKIPSVQKLKEVLTDYRSSKGTKGGYKKREISEKLSESSFPLMCASTSCIIPSLKNLDTDVDNQWNLSLAAQFSHSNSLTDLNSIEPICFDQFDESSTEHVLNLSEDSEVFTPRLQSTQTISNYKTSSSSMLSPNIKSTFESDSVPILDQNLPTSILNHNVSTQFVFRNPLLESFCNHLLCSQENIQYEVPKKRRKLHKTFTIEAPETELFKSKNLSIKRLLVKRSHLKRKGVFKIKREIGNVFLNYNSPTFNYDPIAVAERQFRELHDTDDIKPIPRPKTTMPLKSPNIKKIKSAEPQKRLFNFNETDDFELLENLITNGYCENYRKTQRKYSDDASSIDSNLINENDNLLVPEHFMLDNYSPTSVDTDVTIKYDNDDFYSEQSDDNKIKNNLRKESEDPFAKQSNKVDNLYDVDDKIYAEYKVYEQEYLKEKEQPIRRKPRSPNLKLGLKFTSESQTNDSAYGSLNRPASPCQEQKVSKFCHECGNKYPVLSAKFCVQCGVKRLVF